MFDGVDDAGRCCRVLEGLALVRREWEMIKNVWRDGEKRRGWGRG
jgi:hypothetical protein